MTPLLISLLVLLASAQTNALIACTAQLCANTICHKLTEDNCKGKIVPNGGLCHCCDGCYTVLKQGADCSPAPYFGVPRYVICDDGLECNRDTQTCQVPVEA
ncbi:unnamed protein product [Candidula unifasciata]|uniref:Uncharacterized protein n=1 Tax=Candidula unifasciata TaxID=100452 RepID=A0A8S3YTU2_9EUPU|nr:unnamed protein product [Candidula unifasciata]